MENLVESLSSAYQEFVAAAAGVIESKEQSGGRKTPATDAALESFKSRWELFRVACDNAEEFIESARQRLGSDCLVDEATGVPATAGSNQIQQQSIPPISAVRLEQMSKAVRWLVIELQQHGATAATSAAAAAGTGTLQSHDARFAEDGGQ